MGLRCARATGAQPAADPGAPAGAVVGLVRRDDSGPVAPAFAIRLTQGRLDILKKCKTSNIRWIEDLGLKQELLEYAPK
jgi:hypothetical protein